MKVSPYFWDIAGPLSLVIFGVSVAFSIWAFIKRYIWTMAMCVLIGAFESYITFWSIGKYIAILVGVQLISLLYLLLFSKERTG